MLKHRYAAVGAALAAIAGGATGLGATGLAAASADAATAHPASAAVLKLASVKVSVGSTKKSYKVLVNAKGKPVYLLTGDSATHPKCKGTCLTYWPAVTTTQKKPTLGAGIKGKVAVWHHNHINQVTLNGHPLYTYAADSAGSASGEGLKSFGGVWELLNSSGSGMKKPSSSGGGGGGGY
jgi:predicted lipoprotein with Yx(FWY)xxD motif